MYEVLWLVKKMPDSAIELLMVSLIPSVVWSSRTLALKYLHDLEVFPVLMSSNGSDSSITDSFCLPTAPYPQTPFFYSISLDLTENSLHPSKLYLPKCIFHCS